jgi:glutamine synthetase
MSAAQRERGMRDAMRDFLREHNIHEVECVIADMTGIARGKILPKDLFLDGEHMRLPKSVLLNTVNGEQPNNLPYVGATDPDMVCVPDAATMRVVPWASESVALVIHDCENFDGSPVELAPRAVLRRVLAPVCRARLEAGGGAGNGVLPGRRNVDPHVPLMPPMGRSGMTELGRQSYSIDAVNDFDPFFLELSSFCKTHALGVETLIHEAGAGQMEINFAHGDALELADRVFLFKRAVRETALRHGIFATFMAKPMETEPGSAMHVHQSVVDAAAARIFLRQPMADRAAVLPFHRRPGAIRAVGAADVRAAREFLPAPVALPVGADQRALGLRQPHLRHPRAEFHAGKPARRKPGAGRRREPLSGDGGHAQLRLPRHGRRHRPVRTDERQRRARPRRPAAQPGRRDPAHAPVPAAIEHAGELFVQAFCEVKELEFATFSRVISSWEREHLMLLV